MRDSPVLDRAAMVARLGAEQFDLAIIGGGINGAAIARDAALRGLRVALLDRGDFAGATSSHSSKLIHGGLRYLPQAQFRLVYHSLRERELLRRVTAPHLVHPIRFLMPFYRGRRPGKLAISFGLALYDVMALTPRVERHRRLNASAVTAQEPALTTDGLRGGALYFDDSGDDARLTIENLLDAAYHGAAVANYVQAEDFVRRGGRLAGVAARDGETGAALEIRARRIVNAAGPWVDHLRRLDAPSSAPCVRLTKGVHLVISAARLPLRNSLVLTDHQGRIVFAIRHGEWILIGTTDTDYDGDPADVAAAPEDIGYLLDVLNEALPGLSLGPADVAYAFAGLRALPLGDVRNPSAASREEVILESASGLLTIAGGKLTAHREIAGQVVARAGVAGRSLTRITPLPGARGFPDPSLDKFAGKPKIVAALAGRYGARAREVLAIAAQNPALAAPLAPEAPLLGAEVLFAIRYELARTVSDFLVRRTAAVWREPAAAIAAAPLAARLMAQELGWPRAREEAELAQFRDRFAAGNCAPRAISV